MALSSTPRRTAIALGAAALLLKLGSAFPAAAVPPVPPRPPVPSVSQLPIPDWYAICVIPQPAVGHAPRVCIPDVTK